MGWSAARALSNGTPCSSSVVVRLYVDRIGELRRRRIDPQDLATSAMAGQALQKVQAADNFRNLFEVPVLFYALCAVLATAQNVASFFVVGAWVYVALRESTASFT